MHREHQDKKILSFEKNLKLFDRKISKMSLNSETNEIRDLDLDNLKMHADSSKIKLPSYIS